MADEQDYEIQEQQDGSAVVDLPEITTEEQPDGSAIIEMENGPEFNPDFYDNLADSIDPGVLSSLTFRYMDLLESDKEARSKRDEQYEEGIRRTGMGKDAPGGATFPGASKVVHPVMAEACVDFSSAAIKEMFPPDGPVRVQVLGEATPDKVDVAERKRDFMNWQITEQIEEFKDEEEQLTTQLPLGGSQYLKMWYEAKKKRPMVEFVPIDNILLPFASVNFYTSQRVTEVQDITEDTFLQRVDLGIYRDIESYTSSDSPLNDQTQSEKANNKIEGKDLPSKNIDGLRRVYEITCFLRLDDDSITDGKRAPYILTIDETTSKVLSLYRNLESGDEKMEKLDWYVEFKLIPWRGAYAIGLPHLIGGLSAALTGALRALLDAAHINNSQTMLKLKGGRIGGQSDRIEPTQVIEIEGAPGVDDVRKLAMPMPFNPPSSVLFNLLGWLTDAAKGVVTTAEEKIGEANNKKSSSPNKAASITN